MGKYIFTKNDVIVKTSSTRGGVVWLEAQLGASILKKDLFLEEKQQCSCGSGRMLLGGVSDKIQSSLSQYKPV